MAKNIWLVDGVSQEKFQNFITKVIEKNNLFIEDSYFDEYYQELFLVMQQ